MRVDGIGSSYSPSKIVSYSKRAGRVVIPTKSNVSFGDVGGAAAGGAAAGSVAAITALTILSGGTFNILAGLTYIAVVSGAAALGGKFGSDIQDMVRSSHKDD